MTQPNVFVTGGSRGIGRAIALRFAREGANVVVAARTSDQLDAVVAEIDAAGGKGLAAQMNLRDHGSIEAAVYRALEEFDGTMDVLVNNAGVFGVQPFEDLDLKTWLRFMEVNATGAMLVTQEALASVKESERGHIFNVSSVAGQQGFAGNVSYCASKYALRGFSDALREDLRPAGVRVSTVFPSATDTAIFDGVPGDWDRSTMKKPEDVAEAIWAAYGADGDSDDIQT
jgi:NAD(P)-dependent dehydrogenase (short-subunit alcohol dehydrogenase family)